MERSEYWNAELIEAQYQKWQTDPESVSPNWRFFFEGFTLGATDSSARSPVDRDHLRKQSRVDALIHAYRDLGHLLACLDPLVACPTGHPLLSLEAFGLTGADLDRRFAVEGFFPAGEASLRDILLALKETYCRSIGVEYMHLQDPAERRWLQDRMEPNRNRAELEPQTKLRILHKLYETALLEQFFNKKYVGVTRFSLEGGDAVIPLLDALVSRAAAGGCREIVLGMAHRGRLNVQAHILQKPYVEIFAEFESCYDPESLVGSGDVKYHNGYMGEITTENGTSVRILLANNPSHLEAVSPVVEGVVRCRQDMAGDGDRDSVLPLLIHGDAAFAGQGVVAETLNLSQLAGYRTGGTIHLVINNQIGYTTLPENARSTRYSTDVAKMLMVPIFHVHGEDVEAVVQACRLAVDYRAAFHKDVVLDVVCYRRYGHNEGDEPYFTQPQMYDRIRERPSLHQIYADKLQESDLAAAETLDRIEQSIQDSLNAAYDEVHGSACPFPERRFYETWQGVATDYDFAPVPTAVPAETLVALARRLNTVPEGFTVHEKLARLLERRLKAVESGDGIDWANAETLGFATLLTEGIPVRLSGQDCRRGTFSQRHSVLVDTRSGREHTPLDDLSPDQARFQAFDSMLAETSVLGFEYGYSLAQPQALVIWEAQFGDFVNNAQGIIDLFIASGEKKWQRPSGLVLFLPHGWEGLGPEHSSARPERFLQLCAGDNMEICNPTTPAQLFHLLRRQVLRPFRKPLIVLTPKSLLRHPLATCKRDALSAGHYAEVLDDPHRPGKVRRVLICSGKIYYDLFERRGELQSNDTALIRLEQYYPFPAERATGILSQYRQARQWYWVQEEPENMGAWRFVRPHLEAAAAKSLHYIGRPASASPATGFPRLHRQEQSRIITEALGQAQTRGVTAPKRHRATRQNAG